MALIYTIEVTSTCTGWSEVCSTAERLARDAAELAGYLRQLAAARALARHPLNAKLFAEDLLLAYQRLIRA